MHDEHQTDYMRCMLVVDDEVMDYNEPEATQIKDVCFRQHDRACDEHSQKSQVNH